MATKSISISILNNPAGIPASSDGVMGLICQATTVSTTFVVGTAYLLSKAADLDTLGVTAVNNPAVYLHVSEFYSQAGDGAKLWVLPVAANTVFATYIATEPFKTFIRNSGVADPLNQIKGVFIGYAPPVAAQSSTDFPADVTNTIPILENELEELNTEGYFVFGVIDGYNMSTSVTSSTIGTMASKDAPKVGVCITGTTGTGISSIGLLAGKLARITVGTDPGKVADGAIQASTMYLTNGILATPADSVGDLVKTDFDNYGTKQFIFARTYLGKSGFYWNDGATCDLASNSLSNIPYNRIANKLCQNALEFWTNELGRNVPVDTSGNLDAGYCQAKSDAFFLNYINPLINSGDITTASMTATGVGFTSTKKVNVSIKILPAPSISSVEATIEFVTSL